jgi:hypothetical protein
MPSVIILNVIQKPIKLTVFMLNVVMLNVIMLSVVAPRGTVFTTLHFLPYLRMGTISQCYITLG